MTDSNPLTLRHHSYYAQIQGQMAITSRKWCEFYVYTCNGTFTERVHFDSEFYSKVLKSCITFYEMYLLPELKHRVLEASLACVQNDEPMEVDGQGHGDNYFCPVCNMHVKNEVVNLKDRSICCDACNLWFHFHCVGITNIALKSMSAGWYCTSCAKRAL